MTDVISVKFNSKGKIYFFDPRGLTVAKNRNVIVETAKGLEFGECIYGNHAVEDTLIVQPLRPVVRIATEHDIENAARNKLRNAEAFETCRQKIEEHGLPMKLVSAEFSFDGSKLQFFFTSDGRVDFRELVRDLASTLKARIDLRQIGVRDEAKMLGGLGVCGKQFCCSQFLTDFHPVSIKMAKTQGLSLNPVKISGTCGRLMCCLKYEEAAYEDLVVRAPRVDSFVETPSGKGSVVSVNLLRSSAKVRLEDGNDTTLKVFTFEELDVLGGKARRAEYQVAKAEGRLEEAGFKPSVIVPPPVAPRFIPEAPRSDRARPGSQRQPATARQPAAQDQRRHTPPVPRTEKHAPSSAHDIAAPPKPEPIKKNNRNYRKKRGNPNGG